MNREDIGLSADQRLLPTDNSPRSAEILRSVLIKVLSHATEGHFLLREQGRVIAEVGDKHAPLQAEANVVDTRAYARALLGGNTAAGGGCGCN